MDQIKESLFPNDKQGKIAPAVEEESSEKETFSEEEVLSQPDRENVEASVKVSFISIREAAFGLGGMLFGAAVTLGIMLAVMKKKEQKRRRGRRTLPAEKAPVNGRKPGAGPTAGEVKSMPTAGLQEYPVSQAWDTVSVAEPKEKGTSTGMDYKTTAMDRFGDYNKRVPGTEPRITIGKVHNIGKRESQQDTLGTVDIASNVRLAIVADGMGGLAGGDKVSQQIVMTMMAHAKDIYQQKASYPLYRLLKYALWDVERNVTSASTELMGSTLLAVWQYGNNYHWLTVGDSRIYLFRGNGLIKLNSEHVYERELLLNAVNDLGSFEEAFSHARRKGLTSFIGMGELKYLEGSISPETLLKGDRLLLMSDGVFNALRDDVIADILSKNKDVNKAAEVIEQSVLQLNRRGQDNFTAVIIGYDE